VMTNHGPSEAKTLGTLLILEAFADQWCYRLPCTISQCREPANAVNPRSISSTHRANSVARFLLMVAFLIVISPVSAAKDYYTIIWLT
jgi:multisubunit Na+/H+ antiporter MnhG subunit